MSIQPRLQHPVLQSILSAPDQLTGFFTGFTVGAEVGSELGAVGGQLAFLILFSFGQA